MTNILVVSESRVSTAVIFEGAIRDFASTRPCQVVAKCVPEVRDSDLNWCDVLVCVRGESPLAAQIMKTAREHGRYVIFFLDDDLLHLPPDTFRYPRRKKYLLEGLAYADGFLTSSRLLAQEYLPLIAGDRYGMLETSIPAEEVVSQPPKTEQWPVKLVYAGASTHISQWDRFIAPIWPEISQKYGDRISLTFVGMQPKIPEGAEQTPVHFIPAMALQEFRALMVKEQFDVGVAPLTTNHFTARKYYNKFLEYARCGTCGMYSNCPPYTLIIEDGENGVLVDNTPEAWKAALERVIDDAALRQRCAARSQQILRDRFVPAKIFEQLELDFPALAYHSAPKDPQSHIPAKARLMHKIFRCRERIYLTVLSFKRSGMKATIHRVMEKFKK